jgi:hypothetical protein
MTQNLNSIGKAAYPLSPAFGPGKRYRTVNARYTVPTTGVAGDTYVLAGPLTLDDRIARIFSQAMAALTTATNANLGFYYLDMNSQTLKPVKSGGGNELWSGVSLATAVTVWSDVLSAKNGALDTTKPIRDLLLIGPDQAPVGGIYLVLTLPTANTAGGLIDLDTMIDEATTR